MAIYEQFFRQWKWKAHGLSSMVPWAQLAAPGVMLNKDQKALMRVFLVRGQDLTGTTPEQQGAVMLQANNVLKRLGGRWVLHAEAARTPLRDYPDCAPDAPPMARYIDALRRQQMLHDPGARETHYYLTLTWAPPSPVTAATRRLLITGPANGATLPVDGDTGSVLLDFFRQTDYLSGLLSGVLAQCRPANTGQLYTYAHSTVSDRDTMIMSLANPLNVDSQLCDTWYGGGWYPQLGRRHLRTCSILGYPATSTAWIMRDLEAQPIDFRWVTRWLGMEKETQRGILHKTQKAWVHQERSFASRAIDGDTARVIDSDATRKAEQADAARQELGADIVAYGQFTTTVTVWETEPLHPTQEERFAAGLQADTKCQMVMQAFDAHGFTATQELQHAQPAWLSSLPGNRLDSVRRTVQSSMTLAHLFPGLAAAWTGPTEDAYLKAGPWFLAHTEESSAYRAVNHAGENGHSMVLGPTRAGKSVTLALMVAQWLARYANSQAFWFDLDKSARLLTLLLGGHWYDLGGGTFHGQPLRNIDDAREAGWALGWLTELCREALVPINAEVQGYLGSGIRRLAQRPPAERTLSGLTEMLSQHSLETERSAKAGRIDAQGISHPDRRLEDLVNIHRQVRMAIRPFTTAGDYGWLLDASDDSLQDGRLHTFEQAALLAMPAVQAPVMRHVFHRVEQRFSTDTPSLFVHDEAVLTWRLPSFARQAPDWLMRTAKKSVSLIFCTHSLEQVFNGGELGKLLVEACIHRYFLANPAAKAPIMAEVYARLGLTPEEITGIATMTPRRDVYYSCEHAGRRLFHLTLSKDILACLARNRAEDHQRMDKILAQYGPEDFAEVWLRTEEE